MFPVFPKLGKAVFCIYPTSDRISATDKAQGRAVSDGYELDNMQRCTPAMRGNWGKLTGDVCLVKTLRFVLISVLFMQVAFGRIFQTVSHDLAAKNQSYTHNYRCTEKLAALEGTSRPIEFTIYIQYINIYVDTYFRDNFEKENCNLNLRDQSRHVNNQPTMQDLGVRQAVLLILFTLCAYSYSHHRKSVHIKFLSPACKHLLSGNVKFHPVANEFPNWNCKLWHGNTTKYPLTEEMFSRSYHPGSTCRMTNVFKRLDEGLHIDIVFVGGSMTAGHECNGSTSSILCAWPNRFDIWLRKEFPQWNITVINVSKGEWDAGTWSASPVLTADIFVLDLTVNSQGKTKADVQSGFDKLLWKLHQKSSDAAIMSMETFRTCSKSKLDCDLHCNETLQGHIGDYYWCNSWWNMQDYEGPVLDHYNITFASYRDAVWPVRDSPSPDLPLYWSGLSHPDSIAHQLVADIFENTFMEEAIAYCHKQHNPECAPPTPFTNNTFSHCADEYVVENNFNPLRRHPSWKLYEDVPGKLGWINTLSTNDTSDLEIVFEVQFGKKRQLEVTFLKTYENFGKTTMSMRCGNDSDWVNKFATLDGEWSQRYSLPHLEVWVSPADGMHNVIPTGLIKDGDVCLLKLDMVPNDDPQNKFKLISLYSC